MLSLIESYFSVLMLFGFSQAVLGIYLLIKNKHRPFSNNMLALLLATWGFSCYWFFAFLEREHGHLFSVTVTTFIGPVLAVTLFPPVFLYAKYVFYEYKGLQKKDHLHFLPIYVYILFTLYLYIDSGFSITDMRHHPWYSARRLGCAYIATLQGPFYYIKTRQILKERQQSLKEQYSDIESLNLAWFQNINSVFALVFIIGGVSTIVRSNHIDPYTLYLGYHAIIALSLCYITLTIYKFPFLFVQSEVKPPINSENELLVPDLQETVRIETTVSGKNNHHADQLIIDKLENAMNSQKLYKNPNFCLNDLAEATAESRNSISFALNFHLNKTFYNYVNEMRIEESKRLLLDKKMQHFSIEGIAAQSGFKSMSVFYKFFKDIEKVTPAVYRKQSAD